MGDLMIRISLLVQRGVLCQSCGDEVGGEMSGSPRSCEACRTRGSEEIIPRSQVQPAAGVTHEGPNCSARSA